MYSTSNLENEMFLRWFESYQNLGGTSEKEIFEYFLRVFFASNANSFTGDEVFSREECFGRWVCFMGDYDEACLYFQAVDEITACS